MPNTRLDFQTASFLQYNLAQGHKAVDVVRNPDHFAKLMGAGLSEGQRSQIQNLDSAQLKEKFTALSEDARGFLREVIKDGRYIADWKTNPHEVAQRIKVDLKPTVADEIRNIDLSDIVEPGGPQAMWIAVISVAVAVIVTAAAMEGEELVVDLSGIEKL